MKFIISTRLNNWADEKECQQLLPELIKKLIVASVEKLERLSFPSGDATFLPGWDGIVSCEENIDIVPAGISLWECGATKNVKEKIDSDFNKRINNPLGYEKSTSTFVFVTPRIWEGADEWLRMHQNVWGKVVVYTAVELEHWIETHPSVGMWLAEKLNILPSNGCELPETYWNKWAQGKDFCLPYEIVLQGREDASKQVVETCKNASSIVLRTLTQNEVIAFAIASILTCEDADRLKDKAIVVTDKNAYNDLVEHYNNLILLTTITEDINYVTKKGHSVIVASTPTDQIRNVVALPIIEKNGFIKVLVKMGWDEAKAKLIAKDTSRDINVFRRRVGIIIDRPKWVESLDEIVPAILVGKWMDNIEGDRTILETLSGTKYEHLETTLYTHLQEEEIPLIHIGNMWRIRSPYESISYIQNGITDSILNKFKEICQSLIQDDDDNAIEKNNPDVFQFRQFNQKYSNRIKEGVYQNLCLMSIIDNTNDKKYTKWVDEIVAGLLKNWTLSRYLSNKQYIIALAEASPNSFLNFVENLSKDVLDEIFMPKKSIHNPFGWTISYAEILFALEMLAWDEEYVNRATTLLFRFSEYENESNYANKPINSLYNIFCLLLPQTYVSFENRMELLNFFASKHKSIVYWICKKNCDSLNGGPLEFNRHFRWRLFGKLESPNYTHQITLEQLESVVMLLLQCCDYSSKTIVELITLSTHKNMDSTRMRIIESVRKYLAEVDDIQTVVDSLRDVIIHHKSFPDTKWALTEKELKPYEDLLNEFEPKDILYKNLWLFNAITVQIPCMNNLDTKKSLKILKDVRCKAIQEIIGEKGINGLWNFVKMAKCPESIAMSMDFLSDNHFDEDVCQKYKSKEVTKKFAEVYLRTSYYKDSTKYIMQADKLVASDEDMTIVLYAPGYVEKLAKIAESKGKSFKQLYWQSVGIWNIDENVRDIIYNLISVDRYADVIRIIYSTKESFRIKDIELVNIIYEYIKHQAVSNLPLDMCYIKILLEKLDKSEEPEVVQRLVQLEFLFYRQLEYEMDMSKSRFVKELTKNPDLMIQLVEFAYCSDEAIDEKDSIMAQDRKIQSEMAFHILNYGCNLTPKANGQETIDESFVYNYIDQLFELARKKKRTNVIKYVIGDIIGDIPRDENYPSSALCDFVEKLNDGDIDNQISMRIYNSRRCHSRRYNEGGDQERTIVSGFKKYREKTKLLYPRMTKIFDELINMYENESAIMDNNAQINDLEY